MSADTRVALMARTPVAGQAKTRLAPALGDDGAARLHRQLVLHACEVLVTAGCGDVDLWLTGEPVAGFEAHCLELGVRSVRAQSGGDLGQRMLRVCETTLAEADTVLLVGSDAPGIDRDYLLRASAALSRRDMVIGPARDGGYVMLGLRRADPSLFTGVAWGTANVLTATLERVRGLGWSCSLLGSLPDIDRPEDLVGLPAGWQVRR